MGKMLLVNPLRLLWGTPSTETSRGVPPNTPKIKTAVDQFDQNPQHNVKVCRLLDLDSKREQKKEHEREAGVQTDYEANRYNPNEDIYQVQNTTPQNFENVDFCESVPWV